MRDSTWISEVPQSRRKSHIYGMEFFSNPNASFEPNLRIATPKNYILGPDDQLIIAVTGLNENTFNKKITPDGTIQLPYAGIIHLAGLTIDQAAQAIKNKLQQKVYPALAGGQTQLSLTLGNVKTIRVTIIGEAQRPGGYSVSSLASLFNVLYLSGGPTDNGSLRNIEVIRNNKVLSVIDLYAFLQKGILENDVRLEDQDVIRFPVYQKHVFLTGEAKRPAIYELGPKETLADLVQLGGGFGDTAYKGNVKVVQLGEKEKKVKDIGAEDFAYYIPHNGDSIFIDKIVNVIYNSVTITGAVNHPGMYEYTAGLTLSQLLKKADSLREHAAANAILVKRREADNTRSLLSADWNAIREHVAKDIALLKEDSVYVPFVDSLQDMVTVSVNGFVRNPGNLLFREGMTAADAITLAGGFGTEAAQHRIEISRINKNKSDTLANKLVDIIRIDLDSANAVRDGKFLLQPLDNIFVPRLLNYHSLGSAKLRGEVLFPGEYQIERRDESVKDLIQRGGGLTSFGSLANVQVYRKGLRVGVDLLHEEKNKEFLLQANDSIYIPKTQSYVEVTGGVFNPQIVAYESGRLNSYISAAGGINDKGYLGKAYVQYSNGINKKTRHFLFFRNYPKVLPGSKIVVPEGDGSRKRFLSLPEIATLLTSLTAMVTIIRLL
jgi:protein involved in polysaccharide export with SLBB domain